MQHNSNLTLDEERKLVTQNELTNFDNLKAKSNINLMMSNLKSEDYCLSLMDYLKKMMHVSHIDTYSAFTQIIYCFRPKEM